MELSRLPQQFHALPKLEIAKSENKATDSKSCSSRMPVVGDQVTATETRTSNEGLWVLNPGEIATVTHVDEDGDFTLCNPAGVVSKFVYREHYQYSEEVESDDECGELPEFHMKVAPTKSMRRQSIVGDDVQAAWMARGWTLHTQIHKHGSAALQEMICPCGEEGMTRNIEDSVNERQESLNMLRVINKQLQNSLLTKKNKERELRTKIDGLVARLTAAYGVEKRARETAENALEERILTEEKEKQDMQLALSQDIRMHEESIARVRTSNEALVEKNVQNKRLMKEQQAQIKERQKAVRHLERQIHVLEGAHKSSRNSSVIPENGVASGDRPNVARREQTFTHYDDDGDDMLINERDRALEKGDSKGLLRGARAEKHLEEEKKRLKAQRLLTQDVTTKNTARTMADIKSLPGLDLNKLLGIAQPADSEKPEDRLPQ